MSRLQQHRAGVPSAKQRTRFKGFRGIGTRLVGPIRYWRDGEGSAIVVGDYKLWWRTRSGMKFVLKRTKAERRVGRFLPKFGRLR